MAALSLLSACQWKGEAPAPDEQRKPLPGQSADDLKKPLAVIDGRPISVGDLQKRINQQSPILRARYSTPAQKKELLESMIRFEVLAREAERRGYDRDPEVLRIMKDEMISRFMRENFSNKVKIEDITDEECRGFYESHLAEFQRPEELRASHILLTDAKTARKAAAEIARKSTPSTGGERVIDPAVFRNFVAQYSEDEPTKGVGGDLGFFSKDSSKVAPEVIKAAFGLKDVGSFTKEPVEANDGYHLIVLTGRRAPMNKSFDMVKREIQNTLYWAKRKQVTEEYVKGLKARAKIEVNEGNLERVVVEAPPDPMAPMVPSGAPAPGGHPAGGPHPHGQHPAGMPSAPAGQAMPQGHP